MTTTNAPATERKTPAKPPTSMRYERVQSILESEPAFCKRIGPKTCLIETRFGEKVGFSKETIEITEAIHSSGRDAHKVPKLDVLIAAMRVMPNTHIPPNGAELAPVQPLKPAPAPEPIPVPAVAVPPQAEAVKSKAKVVKPKAVKPEEPVSAPVQPPKPAPAPIVNAVPPKRTASAARAKAVKPEPVKQPPVVEDDSTDELPVSELPPERQPLDLPPGYEKKPYPHYSIQSSIYSLLLSALNLSEYYERTKGYEERQAELDKLIQKYQATCDPLKALIP